MEGLKSPSGKVFALHSKNAAHRLATGPLSSPHLVGFWHGLRGLERGSWMAYGWMSVSFSGSPRERRVLRCLPGEAPVWEVSDGARCG